MRESCACSIKSQLSTGTRRALAAEWVRSFGQINATIDVAWFVA